MSRINREMEQIGHRPGSAMLLSSIATFASPLHGALGASAARRAVAAARLEGAGRRPRACGGRGLDLARAHQDAPPAGDARRPLAEGHRHHAGWTPGARPRSRSGGSDPPGTRSRTMGPYYDHQVGGSCRPIPIRDRETSCWRAHGRPAPRRWPICSARSRRGLKTAAKTVARLVRHAGAGAAAEPAARRRSPARRGALDRRLRLTFACCVKEARSRSRIWLPAF